MNKFLYLSQTITITPDKEIEIQRQIALEWQAFGRANSVLTSKLPISLKRKVYNQCILPVMTRGSETWNLTKKQTMKLKNTKIPRKENVRNHLETQKNQLNRFENKPNYKILSKQLKC